MVATPIPLVCIIDINAQSTNNFGTTHLLYLDGYTDLKKAVISLRKFPEFRNRSLPEVTKCLKEVWCVVLDEFYDYDWTIDIEAGEKAKVRQAELESEGFKIRLVSERHEGYYKYPSNVLFAFEKRYPV